MTDIDLEKKDAVRSFTAEKMEWLKALAADPGVDSRAFEIGFCIAQHINQKSGTAMIADETICHKTSIPERWVRRARTTLRERRWLDWKRTKTANVYWMLEDNIHRVLDLLIMRKDQRDEARETRKNALHIRPPVAVSKSPDRPPVADHIRPPVAVRDRPPVADIHPSSNTLRVTPFIEAQPSSDVLIEGKTRSSAFSAPPRFGRGRP